MMAQINFWRNRRVFVTGGSGLLGSWLIKKLVNSGAKVICLVRDQVPGTELAQSGAQQKIIVVRGDLLDRNCLDRILGEYEIDSVIHLAAQAIVGVANKDPVNTFEVNIRGTWNLLEACRRTTSVKQVVVASSDKAYGDHEVLPYTEEIPLQGRHPYDVSKSCADLISISYAHSYGLPVAITRCGNFYGGGDFNWNRIVPGTIRSILSGEMPIVRSDGQYIRDYIYVEDGASAYMRLVEAMATNRDLIGQAFNFSNESQISVIQIVEKIILLMGSSLKPDVRNEASNEIRNQYLDASKAKKILGWKPEFNLNSGLEKTIDWYRGYFKSIDN